jgi:hypothetical protein
MAASEFTASARRLGIASAVGLLILQTLYTITLALGLSALTSDTEPIAEPMFTALELLIILMAPMMIVQMVCVHAWAKAPLKIFSFIAIIFISLLAAITSSVHFVILCLNRQSVFTESNWWPLTMSFKWPSIAYCLDILSWDFFFPLSMFFAAVVFIGNRLARIIQKLMITSAALSLFGLIGVVTNNMQLRNIGIAGYLFVYLIISILIAILFYQTKPSANENR